MIDYNHQLLKWFISLCKADKSKRIRLTREYMETISLSPYDDEINQVQYCNKDLVKVLTKLTYSHHAGYRLNRSDIILLGKYGWIKYTSGEVFVFSELLNGDKPSTKYSSVEGVRSMRKYMQRIVNIYKRP